MDTGFWGATKPPVGVALDLSHPLAPRGGCWLFTAGKTFQDLAGNSGTAVLESTLGVRPTPSGFAAITNASVANPLFATRLSPSCTGTRQTLVWVGSFIGAGTNYAGNPRICSVNATQSSETSPFVAYGMFRTADGNLSFAWNNGSLQSSAVTGAINTTQYGKFTTIAITIDGTAMTGYINGAQVATSATVGTITYSTPSLVMGGGNATDKNTNSANLACYIYPRVLRPSEVASLHAAPYQMFAPPVWRRYFVPTAAAPPSTTHQRLALLGVS